MVGFGSAGAGMNMLGHFGGSVAPTVTGLLLSFSGNAWNVAFFVSALVYAGGAVCWRFIEPKNFAGREG